MATARLKNAQTKQSVSAFINAIADPVRKKEAKQLVALMKDVTGKKPAMWGTSIVGFGTWHYRYASGREGDWFITGFSPRKQNMTIYIMPGYSDYGALLRKLGPHTLGKSCLYIAHLDDIHLPTLKQLITRGYKDMRKKYGSDAN